ncbi:MAG TPA: ATP-binding protein, partial [Prolixibacteraceae bacterium]|nr:ATP-binding protein [Prolixibacteraceae bacterium]
LFKIKNEELVLLAIQDIKNELDEKELDSWFRLIRVLMHEIMNSIAPITSLSETLSRYYTVGDRAVLPDELSGQVIQSTIRGLNVIKEQGNSLIAFVESYRKFTRLPKPEKKLFKASELLDRVKILYYSLEDSRNAGLKVTVTPPGLEIFADESQISLVLINLVKNALQANEKNAAGEIEVVVCQNTHLRPEILVRDNGPGIAAEMMDEIFVPFFTTRENGSGVGLSISKQIMRLHGGNLHVRSVPGKETVFRMTF